MSHVIYIAFLLSLESYGGKSMGSTLCVRMHVIPLCHSGIVKLETREALNGCASHRNIGACRLSLILHNAGLCSGRQLACSICSAGRYKPSLPSLESAPHEWQASNAAGWRCRMFRTVGLPLPVPFRFQSQKTCLKCYCDRGRGMECPDDGRARLSLLAL